VITRSYAPALAALFLGPLDPVNPPKLLRLKPISLINGMIAQIHLKKYFFQDLQAYCILTKFAVK
jgi:hypothetical protein